MKNIQQTRDLIKYALKYVGGRTLDLGAGKAKYKHIITQASCEYITSDKFAGENVDVVCDIERTAFDDDYFDTVICTQVLEHLPNPWAAIQEMERILKPGGIAIVTVPFIGAYHEDPKDYFRYSPVGLEVIFYANNFETVEKGYYGKRFTVLAQFIEFTYFNPYKKKKGKIARKFMKLVYSFGGFLDRFIKDEIVYTTTYIIARKK